MDFSAILDKLITDIAALAKSTVKNYATAAVTDAKQFIQESEDKLKRWTLLLANKQLTTEDFEWLVMSQKDLAKMEALKQSGLAMARIDAFRLSMLNLIIDTVFSAVKI
ncbi:MAG TPA: hypothetical protein VFS25_16155 [Chitinophaga sp.]|uniref:hypothetical protein n=1 Tax=Chitinophaga sp. TaxID=1869181 RepID=UPI002DBAC173|nr:hypothetical protein [Chitinophaga sp.]HEU4554381.1 hypothetical protein [Chitinophaga sp.]